MLPIIASLSYETIFLSPESAADYFYKLWLQKNTIAYSSNEEPFSLLSIPWAEVGCGICQDSTPDKEEDKKEKHVPLWKVVFKLS